ncbi:hypothetical protein HBI56_098420 [Parastagonospora nodorum]|uniref:Mid2 domain-containing protein n=2 Tax=Phaeosphaeria nodorum (strain SN15 / ATCC MYA-4574 / FGSC 10173) TaxID=321614 RepID=A0A7U2I0R8_PHANO|nr:hypothetical protein SNOG_06378 [Parastagonospora nodorum SN15]KAH3918992.1 hypothetical protein HBH56_027430 [Parastagonospora nodorum]EAT86209.1 hypothetical protein SNOG_06378 [Parastagonospora nodorum SN15]KAH3934436.1 hypothetical protein HBH54_054610 [Parastagonospora nodorum]KAH3976142.1 hypothetical protein HBH51_083060 [Parastagonospora nodorum]KAH3985352.1 hypothetical protein HBH52_053420 [Parastagonospora nodorum]
MMLTYTFCVLLAPVIVYGAAFPWALPVPTLFAPAIDSWSPAPTAAARLPNSEVFRRDTPQGDNTCAFVSGSLLTCSNSNLVCATIPQNGVQGCCDQASLKACVIPTACIASTAMSSLCTDAACSSNSSIMKCTEAAMPECYKWLVVFDKTYSLTTMTHHSCAQKGFTSAVMRSPGQIASSIPPEQYRTVTVTDMAAPSDTVIPLAPVPGPAKPNLAAIIGGTVGGCTVISLIVLTIFLIRRHRKAAHNDIAQPHTTQYHDGNGTVIEYNPQSFPSPTYPIDTKTWVQQHSGPVDRVSDAMPQYPNMAAGQYGIVEVDGTQRAVEVPAENIYRARAST